MNNSSNIGDFTIFGFSDNSEKFLKYKVPDRIGVMPRIFDFGASGAFFFYTTYGEVAESDEALVLKLGFLRSRARTTLSALQLLGQNIVKPHTIDNSQIHGNALLVCLGKKEISFSAYKTLLGVPQLYFAQTDTGIICSDRLKCIVQLLDQVDLNEDIIPMHFLFRSTPGDLTYFCQIRRMQPGEFLRYTERKLFSNVVEDFRFSNDTKIPYPGKEKSLDCVYDSLQNVVEDYLTQFEQKGDDPANLLSGGVDSSLLQHLINKKTTNHNPRSYSFAVRVPSFSREIDYAQHASLLFQTKHTLVDIQPEDYPALISRTIEALAQPPILETEPGMLSIAEFASNQGLPTRHFFSGQGADAIFGMQWSRKLKILQLASLVPGSPMILKGAGTLLKPFSHLSQMVRKGGNILTSSNDVNSFLSPSNSVVVFAEQGLLRQCFGDEVLKNALRYRREFSAQYMGSDHYLEKIHIIDLVTETYEVVLQRHQLFLAMNREQVHPFFDDDLLGTAFTIPANRRYINGLNAKYLLKEILQRRTGATVSRKPKGFSIWEADLMEWMVSGPLLPMVRDIELPGFLSKSELENLSKAPNYFLWELLIFDLFKKYLQSLIKK